MSEPCEFCGDGPCIARCEKDASAYDCNLCGASISFAKTPHSVFTVGPLKCWRLDCPGGTYLQKPKLRVVS